MLLTHQLDALGQAVQALGQLGLAEVTIVERGIHKQQGGGHLHGQRRGPLHPGCCGVLGHGLQRTAQHLAIGVQALQRIAHQGHLLAQARQANQVAAGHARPHVLGGGHALARLGHPGRVMAAQPGHLEIDHRFIGQRVCAAHRAQALVLAQAQHGQALAGRGLAAEKQQVMGQALGRLAVLAGAQLRQQA